MYELVHNDRVIGGVDSKSTEQALLFYKQFVRGKLHSTNARTAEMCKLVENSSRDVQIAFANELSLICDKAGVDVWELINLANKHPRVNILRPGCGVGGHCIAVDPYFIVADYPMESKIIGTAREINNYKSFWCAEQVKNAKLQFQLDHGRKPKIAIMGLAFKPNIDDLRESPALEITRALADANAGEILAVEPNITDLPDKLKGKVKLVSLNEALERCNVMTILVDHRQFKQLSMEKLARKIVIDTRGLLTNQ